MKAPICVLGMHRSGTSCLTGCLEHAGVALGEVVNRSPHNARGNKENKTLRAINEDLLRHNGGSWDRPPATVDWTHEFRLRRDAYLKGVQVETQWGFKDPRCLLTLPFWQEALPDLQLIGTFRHPQAVVHSLSMRPGLVSATQPIVLWRAYNQNLLQICQRQEVPLICFDLPPDRYKARVVDVMRGLKLPMAENAGMFFQADLLRSSDRAIADTDHHSDPSWQSAIALYEKLLEMT